MIVPKSEKPTELGYMELLNGLISDITSDQAIPCSVRVPVLRRLREAAGFLESYSG